MGYIIAGGLSLIFLIWLVWFEYNNKEKHLDAKEHMENHLKNKNIIQNDENGNIQCPKCNSNQIQLMKRGWKITTGFINSSRNERICLACKHKF